MQKKVYKKKESKKFFTKNGKILKSYKDFNSVCSLRKDEQIKPIPVTLEKEAQDTNKFLVFQEKVSSVAQKAKQRISDAKSIKNMEFPKFSAISLGVNVAMLIAIVFLISGGTKKNQEYNKYSIFSSKPLTALASSTNLFGGDPRSATVEKVLEAYNCPLKGYGKVFVKEADKHGIPYWLVAAIAFQESSCGKITPKSTDGEESYNAWGWGVWGKNVKTFKTWEEGISTVSKYLGDNFYSRGITNTCEIMKIYTPPSDGSWCRGVNYFGDIIQNYKTP